MRESVVCSALSILLTGCFASLACAAAGPTLKVDKSTDRLEVRQSQIGFRDTLLFYTFGEQKAVLKLRFDNRDKAFPVTSVVYLFGEDVSEEGIKKWLNNQHSDGLYPEVPEPTSTITLPKGTCNVTSREFVGQSKSPFGTYDNYDVTFEFEDHEEKSGLQVKAFKGATKVHMPTK